MAIISRNIKSVHRDKKKNFEREHQLNRINFSPECVHFCYMPEVVIKCHQLTQSEVLSAA